MELGAKTQYEKWAGLEELGKKERGAALHAFVPEGEHHTGGADAVVHLLDSLPSASYTLHHVEGVGIADLRVLK